MASVLTSILKQSGSVERPGSSDSLRTASALSKSDVGGALDTKKVSFVCPHIEVEVTRFEPKDFVSPDYLATLGPDGKRDTDVVEAKLKQQNKELLALEQSELLLAHQKSLGAKHNREETRPTLGRRSQSLGELPLSKSAQQEGSPTRPTHRRSPSMAFPLLAEITEE